MVHIHSLGQRFNVILLRSIEVTHLQLQLEPSEVLVILLDVILLKLLQAVPLQIVH